MSKIEIISPAGDIRDLVLGTIPAAVPAVPGTVYRITGKDGGKPPRIVRDGNDLIVQELPDSVDLTITDFYLACRDGNDCTVLLNQFDGVNNEAITPQTQPLVALSSGRFVIFAADSISIPATQPETDSGIGWGPILGAGGGVLLLAALAAESSPPPNETSSSPAPAPSPGTDLTPTPTPAPAPDPAPAPTPVAPTVSISTNASSEPVTEDLVYSFAFSESVTGFGADDLLVTGGTVSEFSGAEANYAAVISPNLNEQGSLTVEVPANAATSASNTGNLANSAPVIAFDRLSPDLDISDNAPAVATGPVVFTFAFTEPVTGFTLDSIDIDSTGNEPAVGNLVAVDPGTYQLTVTPPANESGVIEVSVDAGVVTDLAGNGNQASTQVQPYVSAALTTSALLSSPDLLETNASSPHADTTSEAATPTDNTASAALLLPPQNNSPLV